MKTFRYMNKETDKSHNFKTTARKLRSKIFSTTTYRQSREFRIGFNFVLVRESATEKKKQGTVVCWMPQRQDIPGILILAVAASLLLSCPSS